MANSTDYFDLYCPPLDDFKLPILQFDTPTRELQRWKWTTEEDAKLITLVKQFSQDWTKIAEFFPFKTLKNIKKRFLNKHNPQIKRTPWTQREDRVIIEMFLNQCCSWTAIAEQLKGRQPDAIKNRFYGTLRKRQMTSDPLDQLAHDFFDDEALRGLSAKEKLSRLEHISSQLEEFEKVLQQSKLLISQLKSSFVTNS